MSARITKLLVLLVAIATAAAVVACVQLRDARAAAVGRADDLQRVRELVDDMARRGGGAAIATGGRSAWPSAAAGESALSRRLHDAAVAAGVGEQMTSVEPGQPARVRDGDFVETPVFVRLDNVPLRGVVTMLVRLAADNPNVSAKTIELSPPAGATNPQGAETWTADVTIVSTAYQPKR
jgi:hypothetical protein